MHELTFLQEDWLNRLLLRYFPNIDSNYPDDIFENYLSFAADNQALILPEHLRFNGEMELDFPAMLARPLFDSFINEQFLEELQGKVLENNFSNIFDYLIRKEEALFWEGFLKKYPSCGEYTEDIPDLFFNTLNNEGVIGKYEFKKNEKSSIERFKWDFTGILMHKPSNINMAYKFFARKVYHLRGFGIREGIEEKDYNSLKMHFDKYLEKNIPFYKEILYERPRYKISRNSKEITLSDTLYELICYELEDNFDELKIDDCYFGYTPNIDDLLINIKLKCRKKILISKAIGADDELSWLDGSDITDINKKFRKMSERLLSEKIELNDMPLPNKKFRYKVTEKIWMMNEYIKDPIIRNMFPSKFILKIENYEKRRPKSMDKPIYIDDEDNEINLHEMIEGTPNKISDDNDNESIILMIKNISNEFYRCAIIQFPEESDRVFVKMLVDNVENIVRRYYTNKLSVLRQKVIDTLEIKWTQYALGIIFNDVYLKLRNQYDEELLVPVQKIFNKKMRIILHNIRVILLKETEE